MTLDHMALFLFDVFANAFLIVGGLIVILGTSITLLNVVERLLSRSERRRGP